MSESTLIKVPHCWKSHMHGVKFESGYVANRDVMQIKHTISFIFLECYCSCNLGNFLSIFIVYYDLWRYPA